MKGRAEHHRFDPFSLLAGILFLGLGVTFMVAESGSVDVEARWVVAALLVGLGLAGALSSVVHPRRGEPDKRDVGVDEEVDDERGEPTDHEEEVSR